ncbi:MAG: ABC transporter ATP-binding protein, partial [Pseudorhodoplanes sp.]
KLANEIRQRAFIGFLRTETSLQDKAKTGAMSSNLTVELNRALATLFSAVRVIGILLQMAVYVAGLFLLSAPMTVLCLALIGMVGYFMRGLLTSVKTTGRQISKTNLDLTTFMIERLQRTRLIRLSGTERAEARAFGEISERHTNQTVSQELISAKVTLIPEPIAIGFAYIVIFVGGQVLGLGLDRLGLFVIVLTRLMPVVRGIITNYSTIIGKWPSAEGLSKYLVRIEQRREPKGGSRLLDDLNDRIELRSVSFTYATSDTPALNDISVVVPAHRMTALVGPSGAGKSTFIDLLPRVRDPSSGEILFDGVPIEEFSVPSVRSGIAFVPQQPQIFNITAAEHIRYGKEDATDAEVREAARLAGALSFIEKLPQGFDTLLGDGGKRLSGGQRQRLDIARALVRRAPILILDEPTSALDAEAESAFRDALRQLRLETRLTIIVIAHRLSTVADADHIVVLNQGRLAASGTHEDLIAAGGWYADAHNIQRGSVDPIAPSPSLAASGG